MDKLQMEAQHYRARESELRAQATQTAALFLIAGLDIGDSGPANARDHTRMVCRLERLLERERLKGCRKHWSYDLSRHIALKQALDRLRQTDSR